MSRFEALRNAHAGADIIVCGCGASLSGFEPPKDAITIGVNDMGRAFDPDYLMVLNPLHSFADHRRQAIEQTDARCVVSHLDLALPKVPLARFKLGTRGGVDTPRAGQLHYTRNSPFAAVHLAAFMGAKRIGLIGVDFTDHHFFAETGQHPLAQSLLHIDAEYGALVQALAARGITLENLSPVSRLTQVPRRAGVAPLLPTAATPPKRTLAVPRQRGGVIGQLMDALATSALSLGHKVHRGPPRGHSPDTIAVTWNGRSLSWDGPALFCEHGWLPRSAYQISARGINADSHIAPFDPSHTTLGDADTDRIQKYLSRLRSEALAKRSGVAPKAKFYVVPLQMEYDTNLVRHAPPHLRRMQSLIDALSDADPPYPLIFKQHPADLRRGGRHMTLRTRRAQDQLWPHAKGCVNTLLASPHCAGIISINSNVVHDGLVHGVPSVVLGRNVWPAQGNAPFLTSLPKQWDALDTHLADPAVQSARLAYALHLLDGQWTLADARNPSKVSALIASLPHQRQGPRHKPQARSHAKPPSTSRRNIRKPVPARPAPKPRCDVNIYARNRGWHFEDIKSQLRSRAQHRGLDVAITDRPLTTARAWIAVRATESAMSPDLSRTVVQIHDTAGAPEYRPDGPRADVLAAASIQILHRSQMDNLARVPEINRARVLDPVAFGARRFDLTPATTSERCTIGWFGRPELHQGRERHRPDLFTSAMCGFGDQVHALLVGEKLEPHAEILRDAGVSCTFKTAAEAALPSWPDLVATCDALVLTSEFDTAPAPLFDALAAGIPVIARPIGWAKDILTDPALGRFADTSQQIETAVFSILKDRTMWHATRADRQAAVAQMCRTKWLDQALDAALALTEVSVGCGAVAAE